jgi:hypothetical protein
MHNQKVTSAVTAYVDSSNCGYRDIFELHALRESVHVDDLAGGIH